MKRILVYTLVIFMVIMFSACGKSQSADTKKATSQQFNEKYLIDLENYNRAKEKNIIELTTSLSLKPGELKALESFRKSELKKFRQADQEAYFNWLNAKEMNDKETMHEIEKTNPAAKIFISNVKKKWSKRKKEDEIAFKKYDEKNEMIENEYRNTLKKFE